MKHKHAEMIKAKADNMELVIFYKLPEDDWWQVDAEPFPSDESISYFLCLPQHKEAVLNILNGGESQCRTITWNNCDCGKPIEWGSTWWYMNNNFESRIKPRKENRWIAVRVKDNAVTSTSWSNKKDLDHYISGFGGEWQFIEIEVEV